MEYIPINNNIGISLGEITYNDLKCIDEMMQQIKNIFQHSKGKKSGVRYIILYNSYTCNMKNRIVLYYNSQSISFLNDIINQPCYIINHISELKDILLFFNEQKNIKYINQKNEDVIN
jgi:hypothetical protein